MRVIARTPMGMDEWRNPAVLLKTRMLRVALGLAGAFSGRAAVTFSTIFGSGWPWAEAPGRLAATTAAAKPQSTGMSTRRMGDAPLGSDGEEAGRRLL